MKRLLFVLLVLAAGRVTVAAQEIPLTLDEAVARAVKESPRAAELRAREEGSRAAVESRAAAARPHLSVQGGYTRTNHVPIFAVPRDGRLVVLYPDVPDNFRSRLDATWPIYTGGRTESLVAAARAEAEGARQDLGAVEADLAFEAARAYWSAVTAAEGVQVVEQSLARLDVHIRDLRVRFDTGFIPPNEVLTAEAQRARQQVLVIEARNAAELALADLRRLVDLPAGVPVKLATPLTAPGLPAAAIDEQIAQAKAARPERSALVHRIEAAAARVQAAGSSSRPAVAIAGGFDYSRPNPRFFPRVDTWQDSWDVSVHASWSLWDGGRRVAEVAEASAAERSLRARLEEFDSVVALDVRQRRLDLEAGIAAAGAAAEGVRSGAEARRVVDERFAAGVATSTELLDAQVALLQAELDRTRALAGARIAEARLRRALGQ